jgi:hypothetical protein
VITAAALLPHPPLLLRELGGAQDPVAGLRTAAEDAVRTVTRGAGRVVVVGPADAARSWPADPAATVRGFGTTGRRAAGPALPLSLGVGRRLLADAGWTGPVELVSLTARPTAEQVDDLAVRLDAGGEATALLLLGDGSARRGTKAPGCLDERAFTFDDAVAAALAHGDAAALSDVDLVLAEALLATAGPVLRLLGAVALRRGTPPGAALTHREDPYGVSYLVATWTLDSP